MPFLHSFTDAEIVVDIILMNVIVVLWDLLYFPFITVALTVFKENLIV